MQEKAILQVYHAYWDNYLKGDVEAMHPLLADEYTQVGSAEGEVFSNKKDAVQFLYNTIEQVAGKLEMRNRKSILEQRENTVLIHEFCDLYALADNAWIFYAKFRASTLMQQKKEGWKIIHQHSSLPDTKAEAGQNIAIDKIAAENLQLREAVKRRTIELEQKSRELQIEAALERVRAVAMGMIKPDDLLVICKTLFIELKQLGFAEIRNALIGIFHDDENYFTDYDYSDFSGGSINKIPYHQNNIVDRSIKQMKSATDAFTEFIVKGEELEEWKAFRKQNGEYDDTRLINTDVLYYYFYSISQGNVGISTFKKISDEQVNILKKFRNVFDLSYKRYVDISNAEAQAKEARIEAALERVRSRSMAMFKSEELKEVIRVVYEQFIYLNINIEHTGFIVDYKERDDMHIWLADQYASPFEITIPYFDSPHWNSFIEAKKKGEDLFVNLLNFEEKNKFYQDLFKLIPALPEEAKQSIFSKPGLAISTVLLENVGLYIENFSGTPYSDEENTTLMRFGKVFQQTYTRFLDLQKAEAQAIRAEQDLIAIKEAKQKAEQALTELQATQKQLIQSEKMASLGELTAGIAHEIQNPLNFVNNFSEVNKELLAEMKDEIDKGNFDDAKEIANDVIANEDKINHHGKRADAIVKGMLQHSRSNSATKEPTDINKLADEYLRLAYHGLRAKDKSFNATLKTEYDEMIGNINIIPQDIGRVILNLITNAFYAAPLLPEGGGLDPDYKHNPTVWLSTKKVGDKVFISVKDNGPGIPQKILEKIFQPFFTTKPTGQGTGLGLSLSYDIVKAHGGELNVETKEGEGANFIIQLTVG